LLTDLPLQREYTVLADGMNRLCPLTLHLTQPLLFSSSSGRKAEFNGNIRILCQPSNAPALSQLKSLSLYDCEISDLSGIGLCENLVSLNVGRNPINNIPLSDFAKLSLSLESLCLDDCKLEGALSPAITGLNSLRELRMANNQITDLTEDIASLSQLEILGLDGNQIAALPDALTELMNLKTLLLRGNKLTSLPDQNLPGLLSLQLLHVSSNQLTALPDSLSACGSLTHIYANSNKLEALPRGIETLPDLKHLNVAHNAIDSLSSDFLRKFGEPDADGMILAKKCKVFLCGNPVFVTRQKEETIKKNTAQDDDNDVDMNDQSDGN